MNSSIEEAKGSPEMKQRTEEEFYNESRRLRAETMLMADTLRDNPLRFTITNGITMDVEVTKCL